jgi:hypothetical protein
MQHGLQPSYDISAHILIITLLRRKNLRTPKFYGVPLSQENYVQ